MEPKISIIIPVYNAEEYLDKCLQSILTLEYSNYEVIIVNDGSSDNSKAICEKYSSLSDKIIFIDQKNQGVDKARNAALDKCSGDYITFADSDDFVAPQWLKSYFETQEELYDWYIQGICIDYPDHSNNVALSNNSYKGKAILDEFFELEKRSLNGFPVNKLYKRSIIEDNHIRFRFTLKEDLLFNLEYCQHILSLCTIEKGYYHYIQRGSQSLIHKRYPAAYMKDLIFALKDAGISLANKYNNTTYKEFVLREFLMSFAVLLFSMYKKENGINNRKERIKYIKEYQSLRQSNNNISLEYNSKSKLLFAKIALAPAWITDKLFKCLSSFVR